MNELKKINVKFIIPIFENNEGYCIYLYRNLDSDETITCTGYYLPKIKNMSYEMHGTWIKTQKYGINFQVNSCDKIIGTTEESIVAYLSSGQIKGIGKSLAQKIYDAFGADSIRILDETPERLYELPRMGKKTVEKIAESFKESHVLQKIIEFLLPFGISSKQVVNACKKLNIRDVEQIKSNPYILCYAHGITVHTADVIAIKCNYPENSKERLLAHALHILYENETNGHTGMEINEFGIELLKSLHTPFFTKQNISDYTIELIKSGNLTYKKLERPEGIRGIIFRKKLYELEKELAEKLVRLSLCKQTSHENCDRDIADYCCKYNFMLDKDQYQAVIKAIRNSVTVITGGPGCGKTTIIKLIANYLGNHEKDRTIYFMAPSGRAARRITESTGYYATTIHKALMLTAEEIPGNDEEVEFEDCTIIVDEFSMVDVYLAKLLVHAIAKGCRLILVGDPNQLPSVKAGAVLRDILNSNVIPIARLTQIHRQTENSMIYMNGEKIKRGQHDIQEGSDFRINDSSSPQEAEERIIERYMYYAKEYGIKSIYCILPCKERAAGVNSMNLILQNKINPFKSEDEEITIGGTTYRIGDPVMHLKNSDEVSNGDIGYVTAVTTKEDRRVLIVTYFGDTTIEYTTDEADQITLAYAFTVHKSQGSENKIVLTFLSQTIGKRMLKRNLLNTAITRGSFMVELFTTGDNAIFDAIDNDDTDKRITSLTYHLMYYAGEFVQV